MLLILLLYLSSLGWVLERDQVGSSSMVRSIPSAIFPYLGVTHKRNPRGKTPMPSEVVPHMSPTKMPKMTSLNREQLEAEGYIVTDLSEEQKEERRSFFLVQSRTLDEALKVLRHYVKVGTKAFIHDRGPGLYNCYVRKTGL